MRMAFFEKQKQQIEVKVGLISKWRKVGCKENWRDWCERKTSGRRMGKWGNVRSSLGQGGLDITEKVGLN